jgi:hypothetical protein
MAAESLPAATFADGIFTTRDGVYRPLGGGGNQTDGDALPAVYQEQGNASRPDTNDRGETNMHIEISTDSDIDLRQRVASEVEDTLSRFGDHLTRIEVHLGDVNAHKGGNTDVR